MAAGHFGSFSRMLEGIRVVELGVWVAGPSAGGIMADWGADVIKVEGPAGDPMRRMLAVTAGGKADLPSPPFDLDNRGKRSVSSTSARTRVAP